MTVAAPLWTGYFGGESRTLLADGSISGAAPAGWANVSTPVKTGVGATRIQVNGSQAGAIRPIGAAASTYIYRWHSWTVQSGVPSAAYCLTGNVVANDTLALEVGTDSKIRLVRMEHVGGPDWADRVGLTDWSTDALATDDATFKEVSLWIDPLTLGTSHVWVTLFINDVQQWSVDIGALAAAVNTFYTCPPVADAGIYLTLDDVAGGTATSAADAPHLKDWPKPEVHRQLPIADTAEDDWVASGGGSGDYGEWDDSAGPDDDTTYNRNTSTWANKHQVSDGQTEATVGIDTHTVIQGPTEGGPCINIVYRGEGDGAKWAGAFYNSLGTISNTPASPGTTYIGAASPFFKSGGWDITDLTALNFGCQVPSGAEHNLTWRVTMCMM